MLSNLIVVNNFTIYTCTKSKRIIQTETQREKRTGKTKAARATTTSRKTRTQHPSAEEWV